MGEYGDQRDMSRCDLFFINVNINSKAHNVKTMFNAFTKIWFQIEETLCSFK